MTGDADRLLPALIEHGVDEIWDGEELQERYDFIEYHFEESGAYLRARAYLDDMSVVTRFGPFVRRGSIDEIEADDAEWKVLAYLAHRFSTVRRS